MIDNFCLTQKALDVKKIHNSDMKKDNNMAAVAIHKPFDMAARPILNQQYKIKHSDIREFSSMAVSRLFIMEQSRWNDSDEFCLIASATDTLNSSSRLFALRLVLFLFSSMDTISFSSTVTLLFSPLCLCATN